MISYHIIPTVPVYLQAGTTIHAGRDWAKHQECIQLQTSHDATATLAYINSTMLYCTVYSSVAKLEDSLQTHYCVNTVDGRLVKAACSS